MLSVRLMPLLFTRASIDVKLGTAPVLVKASPSALVVSRSLSISSDNDDTALASCRILS